MSVNKVILIGNVGQDPKITYYEGGNCVAQLSLATTEKGYTLQNGTQIPDRTEWHNLIFRGRLGEIVEKYVHKAISFTWKVRYVPVLTMTREASSVM